MQWLSDIAPLFVWDKCGLKSDIQRCLYIRYPLHWYVSLSSLPPTTNISCIHSIRKLCYTRLLGPPSIPCRVCLFLGVKPCLESMAAASNVARSEVYIKRILQRLVYNFELFENTTSKSMLHTCVCAPKLTLEDFPWKVEKANTVMINHNKCQSRSLQTFFRCNFIRFRLTMGSQINRFSCYISKISLNLASIMKPL